EEALDDACHVAVPVDDDEAGGVALRIAGGVRLCLAGVEGLPSARGVTLVEQRRERHARVSRITDEAVAVGGGELHDLEQQVQMLHRMQRALRERKSLEDVE